MQVLYVEDDLTAAKTVELILQAEGISCRSSEFGRDAVALAKAQRYDAIIVDIMLPDIDGYEVIHELRSVGIDTPILILSGLVDRDQEEDGLAFGVEHFLVKPITKHELLAKLHEVVADSREQDASTGQAPIGGTQSHARGSVSRRHKRLDIVKTAQIVHPDGRIACTVLNLSHGGAALRLPDPDTRCPSRLDLNLHAGPHRRGVVCWRHGDKLGVRFT